MRALSPAELLDVWDRGLYQAPVERALTLLGAACPDTRPDALASLDIGRRDAELLALREHTFGSRLTSVATCAQCGERLEFSFGVDDIRCEPHDGDRDGSLSMDGYDVRFRLPDSRDLTSADALDDTVAQRAAMIARCVVEARRGGDPVSGACLPAHVVDAIEEAMHRAAPQADVSIAIACPCCGYEWQAMFDIVSYLWCEIETSARRILRDVHVLACAYGWHEREILALSATRRQCYLDMVRA